MNIRDKNCGVQWQILANWTPIEIILFISIGKYMTFFKMLDSKETMEIIYQTLSMVNLKFHLFWEPIDVSLSF